jgi:ribonuclease HI
MEKVTVYTDGGCRPNPGIGGWAAVLLQGESIRELVGGDGNTTNNRMEMTAAIAALTSLQEPCEVDLYTDSQYLRQGVTQWMKRWKVNGWRTAAKKPVLNEDLWRALDQRLSVHIIRWHWLEGHQGHKWNERCDELATQQVASFSALRH